MTRRARKQGLETPFDFRSTSEKRSRVCAWPGCAQGGEFRTAKSPREIEVHLWLCAEHISEHNKTWNFFEGMSEDEVEAAVRSDTVWQRPTWRLGSNPGPKAKKGFANARFGAEFHLFDDDGDHEKNTLHRHFAPDSLEAKAYAAMDLCPPLTAEDAKARYKTLVKRHHPDTNGGSKTAEERFKAIVFAYQIVLKHLDA